MMRAGRLDERNLGQTVTVRAPEGPCTGLLAGVEHYSQLVSNATIMEPDAVALGRTRTRITLHPWGSNEFDPSTPVEVLR